MGKKFPSLEVRDKFEKKGASDGSFLTWQQRNRRILEQQLITLANFFVGQSNAILSILYRRESSWGRNVAFIRAFLFNDFCTLKRSQISSYSILIISDLVHKAKPFNERSEIINSVEYFRIIFINDVGGSIVEVIPVRINCV